jgi:hypothetical protein
MMDMTSMLGSLEGATFMVTVVTSCGVLLMALAILSMGLLAMRVRSDDLWLLPAGYPGQPAVPEGASPNPAAGRVCGARSDVRLQHASRS